MDPFKVEPQCIAQYGEYLPKRSTHLVKMAENLLSTLLVCVKLRQVQSYHQNVLLLAKCSMELQFSNF